MNCPQMVRRRDLHSWFLSVSTDVGGFYLYFGRVSDATVVGRQHGADYGRGARSDNVSDGVHAAHDAPFVLAVCVDDPTFVKTYNAVHAP